MEKQNSPPNRLGPLPVGHHLAAVRPPVYPRRHSLRRRLPLIVISIGTDLWGIHSYEEARYLAGDVHGAHRRRLRRRPAAPRSAAGVHPGSGLHLDGLLRRFQRRLRLRRLQQLGPDHHRRLAGQPHLRDRQRAAAGVLAFSNTSGNEGFVGGGQIGYNYQFTPGSGVVVGIEADAQYADFGRQRNRFAAATVPGGAIVPGTLIFNPNGLSGLDYFGTVRGRLGYAFDRTLVYATGGFAYGSGGGRQFGTGVGQNDFQTGYAVGGGIEYALPTDSFLNFFRSSAVTVKVEGLYVNLDQNRRTAGAFATNNLGQLVQVGQPGVTLVQGPAGVRNNTEFAVIRAGVNYKFGTY